MNTCFKQLLDRNNRHFNVLLRFFHHRNALPKTAVAAPMQRSSGVCIILFCTSRRKRIILYHTLFIIASRFLKVYIFLTIHLLCLLNKKAALLI
jgi:hypothetical protein